MKRTQLQYIRYFAISSFAFDCMIPRKKLSSLRHEETAQRPARYTEQEISYRRGMDTSPREYSKTLDARNQAAKAALRVHRVSRMLIKKHARPTKISVACPCRFCSVRSDRLRDVHAFPSAHPQKKRLWRRALVVLNEQPCLLDSNSTSTTNAARNPSQKGERRYFTH